MDLVEISGRILKKEELLIEWRKSIDKYGEDMANANKNYDYQVAITVMGLRNGSTYELEHKDGSLEPITNPPVSVIDKIAKGLCWKEKLDADKAETLYKNAVIKIKAIQAELNALQTVHRHID
jgi:hypothetical protein